MKHHSIHCKQKADIESFCLWKSQSDKCYTLYVTSMRSDSDILS